MGKRQTQANLSGQTPDPRDRQGVGWRMNAMQAPEEQRELGRGGRG